jgi:hypothetical protein
VRFAKFFFEKFSFFKSKKSFVFPNKFRYFLKSFFPSSYDQIFLKLNEVFLKFFKFSQKFFQVCSKVFEVS